MRSRTIFNMLFIMFSLAGGVYGKEATPGKNDFFFLHPPGWSKTQEESRKSCVLLKKQKARLTSSLEKWDVRICKHFGELQEVLRFTVFFKDKDKWMASGSMDQQPAKKIFNKSDLFSLETTIPPSCGIFEETSGFHSAGGQCYSAIVGCKNTYVLLESNGSVKDFHVMRKIARSISFKECKAD